VTPGEQYRFGPYHLDVAEHELRRDKELVALTAKTFDLLLILVRGAGRTFPKSELLTSLWPGTVVEESNLSQTVFMLRKALAENGAEEDSAYILTVPRRGYKFIGSVRRLDLDVGSLIAGEALASVQPLSTRARWLWPSVAAAMAAAALGFAMLWLRQPAPLDLAAYRYRPFAYTQEQENSGAWSPDGKTIAFVRGRRLMVQPLEGGGPTQLADGSGSSAHIAWSPDGTRIYFTKADGIYAVSRAGGQPERVLGDADGDPNFFDLSPDGKALAIWRPSKSPDGGIRASVWISSPPGAEPREYAPAPFAVHGDIAPVRLRFSPDGKLLYLSLAAAKGWETWLLPFPAGSGPPRQLFRKVPWSGSPDGSWLPDSRRLVLSGGVTPVSEQALWLADVRNESLTKLTDGSAQQIQPAVSPDGRRLLFTRVEEDIHMVELPLDGSPLRNLMATTLPEFGPTWSPKGGQLAYLTRLTEPYELWVRSSQGEWDRPVVTRREIPALVAPFGPVFSPDGSQIAYAALTTNTGSTEIATLFVSPAAGGAPTPLVAGGLAPSWSPDGASIAFLWLKPNGARVLATLRLGTNHPPFEILDDSYNAPQWSPSGEWIACERPEGVLLVSPDGKVKRTLPSMRAYVMGWSKDSATIYGLTPANGRWSLGALDVRSGMLRKVAEYEPEQLTPYTSHHPGLHLSLSPDGKSLAIGTQRVQTDLWILEGFPK
jgi:Tol biopolymer transport system component/DNA-binding winged helix-turn-helix (wHTH) protein